MELHEAMMFAIMEVPRLPEIIYKAVAVVKGGLASRSCSCDLKASDLRGRSPC